jgi:hypothetical protein
LLCGEFESFWLQFSKFLEFAILLEFRLLLRFVGVAMEFALINVTIPSPHKMHAITPLDTLFKETKCLMPGS